MTEPDPFLAGVFDAATRRAETHEQLVARVSEGIGIDSSTDAYDGSNAEPTRDLTARERDVLCGVISDIMGAVRREGNIDAVPIRGGQDWVNHLQIIRDVIDPRRS